MICKLTSKNGLTQMGFPNETKWGENVTHTATGQGTVLCTDGVIHFYPDELLAVLLNQIHADIKNPIGWSIEVSAEVISDGTKCGVKTLTTLHKIPLPEFTTNQQVAFGILAVLNLTEQPDIWVTWANGWLNNEDRSGNAANAARYAANDASNAANYAANYAARNAASGTCDDITQTLIMCALAALEIV